MDNPQFHRFLELPAELREQIYSYLLSPTSARILLLDGVTTRYKYNLSLLRANKQISAEAHKVFRLLNVFARIETPWDEAQDHVQIEGMVPVIAVEQLAEDFPHIHLRAVIDAPHHGVFERETRKFIVLVEDLEKFCKMWIYSDLSYAGDLNPHLRLRLFLRNPSAPRSEGYVQLTRQLQETILLPFGLVRNLRDVKVESQEDGVPINADVEAEMRRLMALPYTPPETCLERAAALKTTGQKLATQGKHTEALQKYTEAFAAMHIICVKRRRSIWADAWFERFITRGLYMGRHGQVIRLILRVQLVSAIVASYHALGEWEEAQFWGMRTITLLREQGGLRDSPHPSFPVECREAMGWLYWRTGLAAVRLGREEFGRALCGAARNWRGENGEEVAYD